MAPSLAIRSQHVDFALEIEFDVAPSPRGTINVGNELSTVAEGFRLERESLSTTDDAEVAGFLEWETELEPATLSLGTRKGHVAKGHWVPSPDNEGLYK